MLTLIINDNDSRVWLKDDTEQEKAVKAYLHTTYPPDTIVKLIDRPDNSDDPDPEPEYYTIEDLFGLPVKT